MFEFALRRRPKGNRPSFERRSLLPSEGSEPFVVQNAG